MLNFKAFALSELHLPFNHHVLDKISSCYMEILKDENAKRNTAILEFLYSNENYENCKFHEL